MGLLGELRFGDGLWQGAVLPVSRDVPWGARQRFQAVTLGPIVKGRDPVLLVLGGHCGQEYRNDVWRSTDGGLSWQEVSPQEDAHAGEDGLVRRTKWCGRVNFACAAGLTVAGDCLRSLVYVIGGVGHNRPLCDVWVSEDQGRTFVRMCVEAPFGRRVSSGLAACPGRPQRLVLVGGGWNDDVERWDCWLSVDAGEHWSEVEVPDNTVQRRLPALTFTQPGTLVLIGGHNRHTPYADAYVARIKWVSKAAVWQRLNLYVRNETLEEVDASELPWFMSCFTAFDLLHGVFFGLASNGRLAVGRLPPQVFRRKVKEPPGGDPPSDIVEISFMRTVRTGAEVGPLGIRYGESCWTNGQLYLLIAADAGRLFVLTESTLWATDPGVRRQLALLDHVGEQLQQSCGLIQEVWNKILGALLGLHALTVTGSVRWAVRK